MEIEIYYKDSAGAPDLYFEHARSLNDFVSLISQDHRENTKLNALRRFDRAQLKRICFVSEADGSLRGTVTTEEPVWYQVEIDEFYADSGDHSDIHYEHATSVDQLKGYTNVDFLNSLLKEDHRDVRLGKIVLTHDQFIVEIMEEGIGLWPTKPKLKLVP